MKAKFGEVQPRLFFEARQMWNDARGWVGDLDKAKAASSAGRTIDIPGIRKEDWQAPPLGDAAITSNIGSNEDEVKPPAPLL